MALFSFNIAAFVPGQYFHFGSLDFITSEDGRLHASNLEATLPGVIRYDLTNNKNDLSSSDTIWIREDQDIAYSSSESDLTQLGKRTAPPRYPFGLSNSTNVYQHVLRQIMKL